MKARLPKGYGGGGPQNMQQMLKQAQKMQAEIEAKRKQAEQEKILRKEKAKKERQKLFIQAYYAQRSHDTKLLKWAKNNGILNE